MNDFFIVQGWKLIMFVFVRKVVSKLEARGVQNQYGIIINDVISSQIMM